MQEVAVPIPPMDISQLMSLITLNKTKHVSLYDFYPGLSTWYSQGTLRLAQFEHGISRSHFSFFLRHESQETGSCLGRCRCASNDILGVSLVNGPSYISERLRFNS